MQILRIGHAPHAGDEGKDTRTIPIWEAFEKPLREMKDRVDAKFIAGKGSSEFVLPELRELNDSAIRKPVLKTIAAAGFEPWPNLFTTLRA